MHELQKMFPSLTLFSDINWDAVTQEYETHYIEMTFPEYLELKASEGDSPDYLYELAYFEMAKTVIKNTPANFPVSSGVHLNPTAMFLSLNFDVSRMLTDAKQGLIDVHEREHVLCLFKDTHDEIMALEMDQNTLSLLQHLEDGPQENLTFVKETHRSSFQAMKKCGLILDLTQG